MVPTEEYIAALSKSNRCFLDRLIHSNVNWRIGGEHIVGFKRERKKNLSLWPSDSGWVVFTEAQFLSLRSTVWVSTHPAYKAVSLTIEQAYLANQKPFWTATLDIFVAMNGVMGSMWCGLQRRNWITSSSETKGLWSKLNATKTKQRSLIVHIDIMCILGHIDWMSISQLELLLTTL